MSISPRHVSPRIRWCREWAEAGSDQLGRANSAHLFATLWSVMSHWAFEISHRELNKCCSSGPFVSKSRHTSTLLHSGHFKNIFIWTKELINKLTMFFMAINGRSLRSKKQTSEKDYPFYWILKTVCSKVKTCILWGKIQELLDSNFLIFHLSEWSKPCSFWILGTRKTNLKTFVDPNQWLIWWKKIHHFSPCRAVNAKSFLLVGNKSRTTNIYHLF